MREYPAYNTECSKCCRYHFENKIYNKNSFMTESEIAVFSADGRRVHVCIASNSRCSQGEEIARFGVLRTPSLLFVDEVLLLSLSDRDLQHALGWFVVKFKCEMRISIAKSKAIILCQKLVECSLWIGNQSLPQVREF